MLIHLAIKVGKDENLLETLSHRVRCSINESKRMKKITGSRKKSWKLLCYHHPKRNLLSLFVIKGKRVGNRRKGKGA